LRVPFANEPVVAHLGVRGFNTHATLPSARPVLSPAVPAHRCFRTHCHHTKYGLHHRRASTSCRRFFSAMYGPRKYRYIIYIIYTVIYICICMYICLCGAGIASMSAGLCLWSMGWSVGAQFVVGCMELVCRVKAACDFSVIGWLRGSAQRVQVSAQRVRVSARRVRVSAKRVRVSAQRVHANTRRGRHGQPHGMLAPGSHYSSISSYRSRSSL
jgi:hypothetical protein